MRQKFNVRRTSRPQIYAATVTRLAAMIAWPNPSPAVFIALMLVGPRKFLKQIVQIKLNRVKIPTGGRQTSWLFTSVVEDLNSGLPWTNPASGQSATWTRGLRIASPALKPLGHAASSGRFSIRSQYDRTDRNRSSVLGYWARGTSNINKTYITSLLILTRRLTRYGIKPFGLLWDFITLTTTLCNSLKTSTTRPLVQSTLMVA